MTHRAQHVKKNRFFLYDKIKMMKNKGYLISSFPPDCNIETYAVLKKLASAHRALAELKGICKSIPNEGILINTLALQEAKDSSEIENIITTHDELFHALIPDYAMSPATKEVKNYAQALYCGFQLVVKDNMLTNNHILIIQEELKKNRAGFRKQAGTKLKNDRTGEVVYIPPQNPDEIVKLMSGLEKFINQEHPQFDPLVNMALIHHQFESIHPFYDGNGRTGRIINVLYLVLTGLLDIPVLYLSRYLVRNKDEYYRLLQSVRDTGEWEAWVLYILEAVEQTAKQSIETIQGIKSAIFDYKHRIRSQFDFYSQDLINHLFKHPYTKIEFMMNALGISRPTSAKYLDELVKAGFLHKQKKGRSNYYINIDLLKILAD